MDLSITEKWVNVASKRISVRGWEGSDRAVGQSHYENRISLKIHHLPILAASYSVSVDDCQKVDQTSLDQESRARRP